VIRLYRDGDEDNLFALYCVVHPERRYDRESWLLWWRWKFRDSPAGPARLWLYEDESGIIGQYPLLPQNIKVKGRVLKAWQNVDLLTHPAHARRGIFTALEKQALQDAAADGELVVIGFPNLAARAGHLKTGWFDVDRMRVMVKPLDWPNVIHGWLKNRFLSGLLAFFASLFCDRLFFRSISAPPDGLSVTRVDSFDERVNDLWGRVSVRYPILTVRDKYYLNWRYGAVPGVQYTIFTAAKDQKLSGYLVLRALAQRGLKIGVVFDLLAEDESVASSLMAQAVAHCKKEKLDLIYYSVLADKAHIKTVRRHGFIPVRAFVKRWLGVYAAPGMDTSLLRDPESWLVTLGDSDMI
jgi:GNAT superfamily N-acetyltransferase